MEIFVKYKNNFHNVNLNSRQLTLLLHQFQIKKAVKKIKIRFLSDTL